MTDLCREYGDGLYALCAEEQLTAQALEELQTPGSHPHCEATESLLALIDVLVDGRFEEEKKDLSLRFRGSSNQRLIDMAKTRAEGKIVLWDAEK